MIQPQVVDSLGLCLFPGARKTQTTADQRFGVFCWRVTPMLAEHASISGRRCCVQSRLSEPRCEVHLLTEN